MLRSVFARQGFRQPVIAHQGIRGYSVTPQAPPPAKPFFAKSRLGVEVTPLIAFVGALCCIATGAGIHHLYKDQDIRLKPGSGAFVDEHDDKLKKVIGEK
ncbi:hypothetical protein OIO90_000730 [Microbotryomycetes sp. JL221]|nr:hypothetical protein OIO90_000730 [Microbotryomycetes sp. JL221]